MWKLQALNDNNSNLKFGRKQIDISLLTHKMQLHLACLPVPISDIRCLLINVEYQHLK